MSAHHQQHPGLYDGNKVLVDENHPAMGAPYSHAPQPGLEVSSAWLASDERGTAPGLQVMAGPHWHAEDENPAPQVTHRPDYHAMDDPQPLVVDGPAHSTASRTSASWEKGETANKAGEARKRWRLWGIVGLVAALVIVGAVVGGVLGSQAAANGDTMPGATASNDTSAGETSGNDTSVSPAPGSIKRKSRLSATGQRDTSNNYKIRLFHQGPDDSLQYVDWASGDPGWSKACKMNTGLNHRPMPNSPIATCTYRETHNNLNQWQLFYVDVNNTVRGQKFDVDSINPKGRSALINDYPYQVGDQTQLGCYWPYIVSQDADDGLRWTLHQGPWVDGDARYYVNDTNITAEAAAATALVALPVTQQFKDAAGFVYRGADGRVRTGIREYEGGPASRPAWTRGPPLAQPVPAGSALAAFAVGRPYSEDLLNTYVLYQDDGGALQVVWQDGADGDDGWKGPRTYEALGGAEPGTEIACVTQGGGIGSSVQKEQDMNRCFFQEKDTGRLKEVWFDGSEWKAVGFVPIDYGDGRCT